MKRILIWVARIAAAVLLIVVVTAGTLVFRGGRTLSGGEPPTIRTPPSGVADSAVLARGRHLTEAIAPCAACHGPALEGKPFGTPAILVSMAAPNLTPAGVGGSYSRNDWDAAIRHGVAKDGRRLMIMPSEEYSALSDTDFAALAAYLESLPPSGGPLPARKVGLLGRALVGAGVFPIAAKRIEHESVGRNVLSPAPTVAYGKYITTLATCSACHGTDFSGQTKGGGPTGPNLRPLASAWSLDDFRKTIRSGVDPTGHKLDPELMPWQFYAKMTDDELAAAWAYITSVSSSKAVVK